MSTNWTDEQLAEMWQVSEDEAIAEINALELPLSQLAARTRGKFAARVTPPQGRSYHYPADVVNPAQHSQDFSAEAWVRSKSTLGYAATDAELQRMTEPSDPVDHPAHYGGKDNVYEAIKVIEAWGLGFKLGNTVKYISRAEHKANALEDLRKARWYLDREIDIREANLSQ